MKIHVINNFSLGFCGQRQDRKAIEQLKEDNKYSLNLPNQRKINNAIENLSNISGKENIDFLIDVAKNLQYGTNIKNGKRPFNDWRMKLYNAALNSLKKSAPEIQKRYQNEILKATLNTNKPLTKTEKDILKLEKSLIEKIDFKILRDYPNTNIKNIKKNLDYFVISSEIPTNQKLYILKRLNFFMSDKYKINPQLINKKTIALAEMVNDIVIDTPESKIPNIKAINQKQHGMCGAISMARKGLAYEDKPNYIDAILSELDDSDSLMVYDISRLGQGIRIPIKKTSIDYDYAISKGYRIIDASALNWMGVGDTAGINNEIVGSYCAFDKRNFDAFHDTHLIPDLGEDLTDKQDYYRALIKAKDVIGNYKKRQERAKYQTLMREEKSASNLDNSVKYNNEAISIIKKLSEGIEFAKAHQILNNLLGLRVLTSEQINKKDKNIRQYCYLPNEEQTVKNEKIKKYLTKSLGNNINTDIFEKEIPKLLNIITELHSIDTKTAGNISSKIRDAKSLYEAAAIYRYQQIADLKVQDNLEGLLQSYNIPDDETVLEDNINYIIKNINNNNISDILKENIKKNIGIKDNKGLISALESIRNSLGYIKTEIFDNFYYCVGENNRKESLINTIEGIKNSITNAQTTEELVPIAQRINCETNRQTIINILNNYINTLSKPECSEKDYTQILNKIGIKSQLLELKNILDNLAAEIFINNNQEVINNFNICNDCGEDAPFEETKDAFIRITKNFNNVSEIISNYSKALTVEYNGEIINSPTSELLLIKKMENSGVLPTYKELTALQNKFNAIDKYFAQDENDRNNYKNLPKELKTFTAFEKAALNKYKKNIDLWYSEVSKELKLTYNDIKEPLEKLNREIGVKTGNYWIHHEGESGLNNNQEIKIYEHMTDRPYYMESNVLRAIRKIKNSPNSGISSSSVAHTYPAWHAQYISDIKPVSIKNGEKYEQKDVLFHDNTWGAAEKQNTWTDSNGLTRTDYSNGYGGELGYITNEKYLNGNLVENILNNPGEMIPDIVPTRKYKKLAGSGSSFKYSMMPDIITPGKDPSTMSYVRQIRQTLLLSPTDYLDDLTKLSSEMTEKELQNKIKNITNTSNEAYEKYDKLIKRTNGDGILNKGIKTQQDYDNLSNNDELKLYLEKVAIIKSYTGIPELKNFYQANTHEELEKAKEKIRNEAYKNFDYVFGKNADIAKYATESSRAKIYEQIKNFSNENNLNIKTKDIVKIVNSMKTISTKDFDGNIDTTVKLMLQNFKNEFNKHINNNNSIQPESTYALLQSIKEIIDKNLEITPQDMKTTFASGNIADWIDKTFNPTTDEEFVKILNNLRHMTTKEFHDKYNSAITDKNLGIIDISGYDVLKQIQAENSTYQNNLLNTIYSKYYYQNANISKTAPMYDYNKYSRVLHGAKYVGNRTFDDLYIDFYYSLWNFNLEKEFKKVKQQNFEKYGAFPAYPKVQIASEQRLQETIDNFINTINESIESIYAYKKQTKIFDIIHNIQSIVNKSNRADGNLNIKQYNNIIENLNNFINIGKDDNSISDIIEDIENAINSGSKSKKVYKELIDDIYKKLEAFEHTTDGTTMKDTVIEALHDLDLTKKFFVLNSISEKYQNKAIEALNKYIHARSKAFDSEKTKDYEAASEYISEFKNIFDKHRITLDPHEVLNTYLLMNTKDNKYQNAFIKYGNTKEAEKAFQNSKESYESNLSALLRNADILELQSILMSCAQEGNLNVVQKALKESTIEFNDGTIEPLNSSKGLKIILSSLMMEDSLDSAEMFINQFGFGEEAIKMLSENTNFDNARIVIKKIYTTMDKLDKQVEIVKNEILQIKQEDLDNHSDFAALIEKHKENLNKKLKRYSNKLTIDIYNAAWKDAIEKINQYPNSSKIGFIDTYISQAINANMKLANQNILSLNTNLTRLGEYEKLISRIQLPTNSPVEEIRNKYIENCNNLITYKNTFKSNYENINIVLN